MLKSGTVHSNGSALALAKRCAGRANYFNTSKPAKPDSVLQHIWRSKLMKKEIVLFFVYEGLPVRKGITIAYTSSTQAMRSRCVKLV